MQANLEQAVAMSKVQEPYDLSIPTRPLSQPVTLPNTLVEELPSIDTELRLAYTIFEYLRYFVRLVNRGAGGATTPSAAASSSDESIRLGGLGDVFADVARKLVGGFVHGSYGNEEYLGKTCHAMTSAARTVCEIMKSDDEYQAYAVRPDFEDCVRKAAIEQFKTNWEDILQWRQDKDVDDSTVYGAHTVSAFTMYHFLRTEDISDIMRFALGFFKAPEPLNVGPITLALVLSLITAILHGGQATIDITRAFPTGLKPVPDDPEVGERSETMTSYESDVRVLDLIFQVTSEGRAQPS